MHSPKGPTKQLSVVVVVLYYNYYRHKCFVGPFGLCIRRVHVITAVILLTNLTQEAVVVEVSGSMKISRRNPCSPFFSVSYSINRHKILQYLFSIIVVIQYYTASWVG